jgi:hypothetical protein
VRNLLCFVFISAILCSQAQRTDYIWLSGYESYGGYDSTFHYRFGISEFNFNNQSVTVTYDSLGIGFSGTDAEISDNTGSLLFSTNGVSIRNSLDQIIKNGDSLNNGYYLNHNNYWYLEGNPLYMLLQALPNPRVSDTYDLFYVFIDTDFMFNPIGKQLQQTQVFINSDHNGDSVNFKNKAIYDTTLNICLAAVKHGNGRDWWICTMDEGSNCYNLMLYDGSGTLKRHTQQCMGYTYYRPQTSFMRFSPNGQWMMSVDNEQGLVDFFVFDRCNGELSLKEQVYLPEVADSQQLYLTTGGEYSPGSRYAYLCSNARLYQFDMEADSIGLSKTIVGTYHPANGPAPLSYNYAQLAPDGKIYICSGNTTYYVAIVNNPDSAGIRCDFQDPGMQVPSFISDLPYFPNYRLGSLYGSSCDTLAGLQTVSTEQTLKVFPNPAIDYAIIDYGFIDWIMGANVSMEVINAIGQEVYIQPLPMYSGFQKLDVSPFASGMYTVFIKQNNGVIASQKFVKQ